MTLEGGYHKKSVRGFGVNAVAIILRISHDFTITSLYNLCAITFLSFPFFLSENAFFVKE